MFLSEGFGLFNCSTAETLPWLKRGQESSWCAISLHLGCWNMWGKATTKITISLGLGDSYQPSLSHWYWQGHIPCIYCNRIYMILNGRIGTVCCSQGTRKHLRPTARKKVSVKNRQDVQVFFSKWFGVWTYLVLQVLQPVTGNCICKNPHPSPSPNFLAVLSLA